MNQQYSVKSKNVYLEQKRKIAQALICIHGQLIADLIEITPEILSSLEPIFLEFPLFCDFEDLYIFPGLVDINVHIHPFNNYQDITPTTCLALMGGTTTIISQPFNCQDENAPIGALELSQSRQIKDKIAYFQNKSHCDYSLVAYLEEETIDNVDELLSIDGVLGAKIFLNPPSQMQQKWIDSQPQLYQVMEQFTQSEGAHESRLLFVHAIQSGQKELSVSSPLRMLPLFQREKQLKDELVSDKGGDSIVGQLRSDKKLLKQLNDQNIQPLEMQTLTMESLKVHESLISVSDEYPLDSNKKERKRLLERLNHSFGHLSLQISSESQIQLISRVELQSYNTLPKIQSEDGRRQSEIINIPRESTLCYIEEQVVDSPNKDENQDGDETRERQVSWSMTDSSLRSPFPSMDHFRTAPLILKNQRAVSSKQIPFIIEEENQIKNKFKSKSILPVRETESENMQDSQLRRSSFSKYESISRQIAENAQSPSRKTSLDQNCIFEEQGFGGNVGVSNSEVVIKEQETKQSEIKKLIEPLENLGILKKYNINEQKKERSPQTQLQQKSELDKIHEDVEENLQSTSTLFQSNQRITSLSEPIDQINENPQNNLLTPKKQEESQLIEFPKSDNKEGQTSETSISPAVSPNMRQKSVSLIQRRKNSILGIKVDRKFSIRLDQNPTLSSLNTIKPFESERQMNSQSSNSPSSVTELKKSKQTFQFQENQVQDILNTSLDGKVNQEIIGEHSERDTKLQKQPSSYNSDYLNFLAFRPPTWEYFGISMIHECLTKLVAVLPANYKHQAKEALFSDSSHDYSPIQEGNLRLLDSVKNDIKVADLRIIFSNIGNSNSLYRLHQLKKTFSKENIKVYAQVSSSFLYFHDKRIPSGSTIFQCEPAIATQQNKDLLINAFDLKMIDCISSYHFPARKTLKCVNDGDFRQAVSGLTNIGMILLAPWCSLLKREKFLQFKKQEKQMKQNADKQSSIINPNNEGMIDSPDSSKEKMRERKQKYEISTKNCLINLCRNLTIQPAQMVGIDHFKGSIEQGKHADFFVWDPYDVSQFQYFPSGYEFEDCHIYKDQSFYGVIHKTFLRGQIVYERSSNSEHHFAVETHGQLINQSQ